MPLQSLTQQATSNELRALGKTAHNSQLTARCKFSTFNLKSPERTSVPRQAVECEARNPCIHDQNDIKSAVGTTESVFLSYLRHSDFGVIHFCRHSALRAPYLPIICRSFGAISGQLSAVSVGVSAGVRVRVQSSVFLVLRSQKNLHSTLRVVTHSFLCYHHGGGVEDSVVRVVSSYYVSNQMLAVSDGVWRCIQIIVDIKI